MSTTVYYPRVRNISFYDNNGVVCGGMYGLFAKEKFIRLLKSGKFPRISLRKKVRISLCSTR
jgi:hypothetical protein